MEFACSRTSCTWDQIALWGMVSFTLYYVNELVCSSFLLSTEGALHEYVTFIYPCSLLMDLKNLKIMINKLNIPGHLIILWGKKTKANRHTAPWVMEKLQRGDKQIGDMLGSVEVPAGLILWPKPPDPPGKPQHWLLLATGRPGLGSKHTVHCSG